MSGVYKNMTRGIVALVFRCRSITGQPSPTSESKAVEWRPVSEVLEAMDPAYAVRITDAFDPAVRVRIHDGVDLLDDAGRSPRTTPRVTSEEGSSPCRQPTAIVRSGRQGKTNGVSATADSRLSDTR